MKNIYFLILNVFFINFSHAELCSDAEKAKTVEFYFIGVRHPYDSYNENYGTPGISKFNGKGQTVCGCRMEFGKLDNVNAGTTYLEWDYDDILMSRQKGLLTREIIEIIKNSTNPLGGCPTDEGYKLIYKELSITLSLKHKILENEMNQRLLKEIEKQDKLVKTFCKSSPKIYIHPLEDLANTIGVNPRDLSLERVKISENRLLDIQPNYSRRFKCVGTFYSPKGVFSKRIDFDEKGIIQTIHRD